MYFIVLASFHRKGEGEGEGKEEGERARERERERKREKCLYGGSYHTNGDHLLSREICSDTSSNH
jgi:hypothetical protein